MNRVTCSCGSKTRRADGVCYWCHQKARRAEKITRTHCAYCWQPLPDERVLISPYHYECSIKVSEISKASTAKVTKAVRNGDLAVVATLMCADCGKQASHYDHRCYSKPLDVEPVCRSCNYKRGPALDLPVFALPQVGAGTTATKKRKKPALLT